MSHQAMLWQKTKSGYRGIGVGSGGSPDNMTALLSAHYSTPKAVKSLFGQAHTSCMWLSEIGDIYQCVWKYAEPARHQLPWGVQELPQVLEKSAHCQYAYLWDTRRAHWSISQQSEGVWSAWEPIRP